MHLIAENKNIIIRQMLVDSATICYDIYAIQQQFQDEHPHWVIISHASNVTGAVAPIRDIFSLAKRYNSVTIADMCQTAGLIDTDISSSDFDYVVFAGHKTLYGPLGISGFICQYPEQLPPLIYGGTGIESANQDMPMSSPERFEAGSHSSIAIAGLNASVKWILDTGIQNVYEREQDNKRRLVELLTQYDNIRIIQAENQIGLISCLFNQYSSDEVGQVLSEQHIAFRSGLHCAPYAHRFINTFPAGTVRFSVGYFNTEDDFSMLDHALQYIYENS